MSAANDLIERMEREAGQRIDDSDGENFAMAGLFGALSRIMGQSQLEERDDVAVGTLIKHQMSPAGRREKESYALLAQMLRSGLSPDEIRTLTGND